MHASICDIMLDLVQNSIEAQASHITLEVIEREGRLDIMVADNGRGMSREILGRALDPFYTDGRKHPGRRVGLGLPFLKQTTEQTGGALDIQSEPGCGTRIRFTLESDHPDTPPLGDLPAAILSMMNFDGSYNLVVERRRNAHQYRIERSALLETLEGMQTADDLALARTYLAGQEQGLLEVSN